MKFFSKAFFIGLVAFLSLSNIVFAEDTTRINLNIYTYDGSLYEGEVDVSACYENEGGTSSSINAFCAIEKVANENNWQINKTWYPFGVTLDGLHTYTADFSNNRFWVYFINGNPGEVGLNSYLLKENDRLDLFFGVSPLKIETDKFSSKVNESVSLTAKYFDFMSWSWSVASGADFFIDGNIFSENTEGYTKISSNNEKIYEVFAKGEGFSESNRLILKFENFPQPAGGGGSAYETEDLSKEIKKDFDIKKASDFLFSSIQKEEIVKNQMILDWLSMALSTTLNDSEKTKIKQLLISNPIKEGALTTDYIRRTLALMALNINPYDAGGINYIKKIEDSFLGGQFGSQDMFNDDAFAITALLKAGYNKNDEVIKNSLDFIIRQQDPENGSWKNIDLTSMAIWTVSFFKGERREDDVLNRASNYLKKNQKDNGGFGDPFSTSWAIQAIYSLGDDPKNWIKNKRDPISYLASLQDIDGGIKLKDGYIENRVWATSYALIAINGKKWNDILKNFDKIDYDDSPEEEIIVKKEDSIENKTYPVKSLEKKVMEKQNTASIKEAYQNIEKTDKKSEKKNLFEKIKSFFSNIF